jgi:hypothetical protein
MKICYVMGCKEPATYKADPGDGGSNVSVCAKCADELNATMGWTVWNVELYEQTASGSECSWSLKATPAYYAKHVKCKSCEENTGIDVYDVLQAFDVTCPAIQHAVKKLLRCGNKPGENELDEIRGAITSLNRAVEMRG